MEKKENASKLISSLVALSLATTLGVPTIALADATGSGGGDATIARQGADEGTAAPQEQTGSAVAKIGAEGYETLQAAVDAAKDGDTIALVNDITLDSQIVIQKSISLDLNGKTIKRDGGYILDIYGNVRISNGTITLTSAPKTTAAVWVNNTASLEIEKDATVNAPSNSYAIAYDGSCTAANVTLKGSLKGGNGIAVLGTIVESKNTLHVDGAKIEVDDHAIYQAGSASTDFSINNSTIIGGSTGIEVRAGKLAVSNCDIEGNGTELKVGPNGNGATTDGAAIAIAQHTTKQAISVEINGGSVSGKYAIYESNPEQNSAEDVGKISLEVNSGNLNGKIYSEDLTGFISGGTFSDFSALDYTTSDSNVVVRPNEDITLSKSVVLRKGETVTVDLGDGHSISKDSMPFEVLHGKLSFVGHGTVYESVNDNFGAVVLKGSTSSSDSDYSELAVGEGVTLRGWSGVFIDQNNKNAYGVKVTLDGKALNPGMDSHATAGYGIYLNGQITDKVNCPEITVGNTATVASKGTGIYAAGYGKWNLSGNISGADAAVEIRSGEMNISGGEYEASAENFSCDPNGNGTTTVGAALAIAQHTTKKDIAVTINGGHFKGVRALNESNPQNNDPKPQVSLAINGGQFDGGVAVQDAAKLITGGTFSSEPDASYIADGYEAVKSGANWVVQVPYTPAPAPTTETTTTTNPDGTTTTTVTDKKTGESTSTTEGVNGTTVVEKTDASGNTTTKVTVPEGAATNAGAPVEIPAAVEVTKGKEVSISAPAGTIVAIPAAADAGNVAVIVHADGTETVIPMSLVEDGKAIVQLDGNETIKIVDNAKEFTDVADDYWAAGDIDFASSHEIFKGIGNGNTYEPETALTRNMMMTVLARTAGADTSESDPWYAKGQEWAVENGVSNGLWGEDNITREQLVTMLFNFANLCGLDTSARADVSGMVNADAVSDWATEAVQWAVAEGILKGVDNIDLAPQGLATRAQAAAFMQRYVKTALL